MRWYVIWMCLCSLALAQRGFGLSFQGRFNYFTDTGEPVPPGLVLRWRHRPHLQEATGGGRDSRVGVVWVYKGGPQEVRLPLHQ
jgi:hypothetical protein